MQALDKENNPQVLRELAKLQNAEIIRLQNLIKKIESEKDQAKQAHFNIEESLLILRKKLFGRSSEKTQKDNQEADDQTNLFDRLRSADEAELTLHSQNLVPPPSNKMTKKLDEEIILSELTENELKEASLAYGLADASHEQWQKIEGLFEETREVHIIERKIIKKIFRRQKYKLKKQFNDTEKEQVIIAAHHPGLRLAPGCGYSVDFAVTSLVDKYLYHMPLERQVREMKSLGLDKMSTQVLYNLGRLAALHLEKVVELIKSEILERALVHGDETPWPINNNKDSDGYMWIISNQAGSLYKFEPSRSGKYIKEILSGYKGYLMSDGFSGYLQFKKKFKNPDDPNSLHINLVQCHAHARREFKDIEGFTPEVKEYLEFYEQLSAVEKQARDFDDLKNLRQTKSKPIIDKMRKWLEDKYTVSRPESEFRSAIQYSFNHWPELTKFLDDPIIPLTNNEAERAIRQSVVGRKNFYGSRSIDGADLAATVYTIVESCKKFEIDPKQYILSTIKASIQEQELLTPYKYALRHRSPITKTTS